MDRIEPHLTRSSPIVSAVSYSAKSDDVAGHEVVRFGAEPDHGFRDLVRGRDVVVFVVPVDERADVVGDPSGVCDGWIDNIGRLAPSRSRQRVCN
jgi:hypothetical protein